MKKYINFSLICCIIICSFVLTTGCISGNFLSGDGVSQEHINPQHGGEILIAAKPFEKRYSSTNDVITVNGETISVSEENSVWILTSRTLNNLILYSNSK